MDNMSLSERLNKIFRVEPTDAQISVFQSVVDENGLDSALNEAVNSNFANNARDVVSLYQVFYGREPDSDGLDFWTSQVNSGVSLSVVAEEFATANEFDTLFGGQPPVAVVSTLYRNLLGREPDFEGLEFWSGQVQSGNISLAELSRLFAVSPEFQARAEPFIDAFLLNAANGTQDYDTSSSLFNEPLVDTGTGTGPDAPIPFTVLQNDLSGTDGDDVFTAPIVQTTNGSGAVTNTFESGDVFTGGGGTDTINVDLTGTVTGQFVTGPSISTTSTGVEKFFIRTQFDGPSNGNNLVSSSSPITNSSFGNGQAKIDAQNNAGVREFWSVDGRADLGIEDIRIQPSDVTLGFRDGDPGVSFAAFYDPAALQGDLNNSRLTLSLDDLNRNDLRDFPVDGVIFTLGGNEFQLRIDRADNANSSYTAFATALQAQVDADTSGNLDGVVVTANAANNTIQLNDQSGGIFQTGGYTFVNDRVPASGDLKFDQSIGAPTVGAITQGIVLDGVGRGQEGGVFVAGSMGGRDGIEVFNVDVDNASWVQLLSSTNNILETVNVLSTDTDGDGQATGSLNIGVGTGTDDTSISNSAFNFPRSDDDRVGFGNGVGNVVGQGGITDVQVFNAAGFDEELKVAASLTSASINKYLSGNSPVVFDYDLSDADSNLNLRVDNALSRDVDFRLDIDGGDGNDRINLSSTNGPISLSNISIDGDRDDDTVNDQNTLELVGINAGIAPGNTFSGFEDIDDLILAGGRDSVIDVTGAGMLGLDSIVVKTNGPAVNTTIINAEAGSSISIDGGNQVLGTDFFGNSNANNNQGFGTIQVLNNPNQTLEIDLDNKANSTGQLTVGNLVVGPTPAVAATPTTPGIPAGNSAVRIIDVVSNGVQNTTNTVSDLDAGTARIVNFRGSQDLNVTIDTLATGAGQSALITGSNVLRDGALTGDLTLTVDGDVLNNGNNDVITGTTGTNDTLNLGGNALTSSARISAFEAVNFVDNIAGTFNAANIVGVNTFSIEDVSGDFALSNVVAGSTINVDRALAANGSGDISIDGRNTGPLTVNLLNDEDPANPAFGTSQFLSSVISREISVFDANRVTVNLADTDNPINLNLRLDQESNAGLGRNVENLVQTVEVNSLGNNDTITFSNAFASTLDVIDLSGVRGRTENVTIVNADDPATAGNQSDDTDILLNGRGGTFTLRDNDGVAGNVVDATGFGDNITFVFADVNPALPQERFEIENFIAIDGATAFTAGGNLSNRTILDVTAFGVRSTADLEFEQLGADTRITLDGADKPFEIILEDTLATSVGEDNFEFI